MQLFHIHHNIITSKPSRPDKKLNSNIIHNGIVHWFLSSPIGASFFVFFCLFIHYFMFCIQLYQYSPFVSWSLWTFHPGHSMTLLVLTSSLLFFTNFQEIKLYKKMVYKRLVLYSFIFVLMNLIVPINSIFQVLSKNFLIILRISMPSTTRGEAPTLKEVFYKPLPTSCQAL